MTDRSNEASSLRWDAKAGWVEGPRTTKGWCNTCGELEHKCACPSCDGCQERSARICIPCAQRPRIDDEDQAAVDECERFDAAELKARNDATDARLRELLGPCWNHLWGPMLERLGSDYDSFKQRISELESRRSGEAHVHIGPPLEYGMSEAEKKELEASYLDEPTGENHTALVQSADVLYVTHDLKYRTREAHLSERAARQEVSRDPDLIKLVEYLPKAIHPAPLWQLLQRAADFIESGRWQPGGKALRDELRAAAALEKGKTNG